MAAIGGFLLAIGGFLLAIVATLIVIVEGRVVSSRSVTNCAMFQTLRRARCSEAAKADGALRGNRVSCVLGRSYPVGKV